MKKTIKYLMISLIFLSWLSLSSCRKEVPQEKSLYVGTWSFNQSSGNSSANGEIVIENSGKGSYSLHIKKSNGSTSDEEGEGNVKIKNGDLIIGIGPARKKYSVYKEPTLLSNGDCTAVFGGNTYIKSK